MSDAATLAGTIDRDDLVAELRRMRPELEREGVTGMALFGSRARRDNRPDSDIDLVIEVDEERKFSLIDLIDIELMIGDRFGVPAYMAMRRSLDADLVEAVRRDGVTIF